MISDKESGGESYVRVQQQQPRDGSRVMSWRFCTGFAGRFCGFVAVWRRRDETRAEINKVSVRRRFTAAAVLPPRQSAR